MGVGGALIVVVELESGFGSNILASTTPVSHPTTESAGIASLLGVRLTYRT